ncbi:MAG: alcohol dehydrogenase catalytic domain-containing protein [Brevefilum sp.]|nr:alcohol dehydrogenase catalytic domain-containing protein [Brevefilum sp.]
MTTKLDNYRQGKMPTSSINRVWPLYGAGFENLGKNDQPIEVPMPDFGPDELLIRHDACGLCFSDIKVIRQGEDHPRIYRNMGEDPVVLGHEVVMTVVGVGENLKDQYKPGDRFIIQADIFVDGVGYAYGYEIQGGLSQYNVIDQRILNGDHGNYLIPIHPETGYAESALVEPWACVIAAYYLQYRQGLKDGGTAWFVGPETGQFSLSEGFDQDSHPAVVKLTEMNGPLGEWLRKRAEALGVQVVEVEDFEIVEDEAAKADQVDDIILLSPTIPLIEKISPYLAYHGVLTFYADQPFTEKANLDIGRVHYNRWLFLGGNNRDLSAIYRKAPQRSKLRKGGQALFVGAGGPMGRMHVQHAIESKDHPRLIVCSDASDARLQDLDETFGEEARAKGIEWICTNPMEKIAYEQTMGQFEGTGFDDIIILVPIPAVIADSAPWLAEDGVMNVFAGVARGTTAKLDLNDMVFRNARVIGHSASQIEDMLTMLNKVEDGELSTNRSVAAVGSLEAAKDGLQALIDATYPGKVVIFPNIKDLPLTSVSDLATVLPEVAEKLKDGRSWTKEAENAFLEAMLKDEIDG